MEKFKVKLPAHRAGLKGLHSRSSIIVQIGGLRCVL